MADVDFRNRPIRCVCGGHLGEHKEPMNGPFGKVPWRPQFARPCGKCAAAVRKYGFDEPCSDYVLVMQSYDLWSGEVDPDEVEIVLNPDPNCRHGDRGGTPVDPDVLFRALERKRRTEKGSD